MLICLFVSRELKKMYRPKDFFKFETPGMVPEVIPLIALSDVEGSCIDGKHLSASAVAYYVVTDSLSLYVDGLL